MRRPSGDPRYARINQQRDSVAIDCREQPAILAIRVSALARTRSLNF